MDTAELALALAEYAHTGQTDKAGHDYIEHPIGVAAILVGLPEYARLDEDEQGVALEAAFLHDVLEDTPLTSKDLRDAGIGERTIQVVELLTHKLGEPRKQYIARIMTDVIATAVKIADIMHNTLPIRLAKLDPATRARLEKKYTDDLAQLRGTGQR